MRITSIIILNWNAGADTWKCLQEVLSLEAVRIAVLDNGSTDESIPFLQQRLEESGHSFQLLNADEVNDLSRSNDAITLIRSSDNLGFAKGVNCVLRPLLQRNDVEFVWLLNNDALAEESSLDALRSALNNAPQLGFAGSVIMDGTQRDLVQCFGVRYFKWMGVARMQFKNRDWANISAEELVNVKSDFQHGASLLVRMETIRRVGLMDEDFFLYSEEHDWQERALEAGYSNKPVAESRVFHLGSMSTANSRFLFFYHYCRSSVLFSRKHHSMFVSLFATIMLFLITVLRTKLNFKSMGWTIKGMKEAWMKKL